MLARTAGKAVHTILDHKKDGTESARVLHTLYTDIYCTTTLYLSKVLGDHTTRSPQNFAIWNYDGDHNTPSSWTDTSRGECYLLLWLAPDPAERKTPRTKDSQFPGKIIANVSFRVELILRSHHIITVSPQPAQPPQTNQSRCNFSFNPQCFKLFQCLFL